MSVIVEDLKNMEFPLKKLVYTDEDVIEFKRIERKLTKGKKILEKFTYLELLQVAGDLTIRKRNSKNPFLTRKEMFEELSDRFDIPVSKININLPLKLSNINGFFGRDIIDKKEIKRKDKTYYQHKVLIFGAINEYDEMIHFFDRESSTIMFLNLEKRFETEISTQGTLNLEEMIIAFNSLKQMDSRKALYDYIESADSPFDTHIIKAHQLSKDDNLDGAIEEFEKAISLIKSHIKDDDKRETMLTNVYVEYVKILTNHKQIKEAFEILSIIQETLSNTDYKILEADIYVAQKNMPEAIHILRRLRDRLGPSSSMADSYLCSALGAFANDDDCNEAPKEIPSETRTEFNQLVSVDYKLSKIFVDYIYGEREEAEECVKEALLISMSTNNLSNLAYGYYLKGQILITKDYQGRGEIKPFEALSCLGIAIYYQKFLNEEILYNLGMAGWVSNILFWVLRLKSNEDTVKELYEEFQGLLPHNIELVDNDEMKQSLNFVKRKYIIGKFEHEGKTCYHDSILEETDKKYLKQYWKIYKDVRDEIKKGKRKSS